MGVLQHLTRQRNAYNELLLDSPLHKYLSAFSLSLADGLEDVLRGHVKGTVLDAGAGHLNGRRLLQPYCARYVSIDIERRSPELDHVGDVRDMSQFEANTFDTVYTSQVLEHVAEPWRALREFQRVLKPGGRLIVQVPFLVGLHEEPYDFFRYTPYGLKKLVEAANFIVEEERRQGGLFAFIAHPFSYVLVLSFWNVPVLRWLMWAANYVGLVLPARFLDRVLQTSRKYPGNVLMVACKPATTS